MAVEGARGLDRARTGIAAEQRRGGHQDTGEAVAALAGLLGEEGGLKRVRTVLGAQALDGGHRPSGSAADRPGAGMHRLAVEEHHAAAAFLEPAAEARALE